MMTESHKTNTTPWATVLLAVAALLGALALYQVAELLITTAQAQLAMEQAIEAAASGPNNVDAQVAESKSAAEALKKDNLFAPPPPKENPVREVLGILGDEALINDKWYKAGDSVGDAKILAVEPTKVRISWNGQEKDFAPLGAEERGAPGGGPPPGLPEGIGGRAAEMLKRAMSEGERPRSRGPGGMPAEERAELRERFRNASAEDRAKMREEMRTRSAPRAR